LGWLQMSKQELRRVEVLTEVLAGRRTTESAAGVLGVSLRQAQRLAARYRDGGGGLIHKSRGRPASNKLSSGVRELVLELVRQHYRDFGPTLAAEVLLDRHGIKVSRETTIRIFGDRYAATRTAIVGIFMELISDRIGHRRMISRIGTAASRSKLDTTTIPTPSSV
jgi:transposase